MDESCFYEDMVPSYGYARRGKRLAVSRSLRHKSHRTLLMAINTKGVVGWQVIDGPCRSNQFSEFIDKLPAGSRLLLDNASIHKTFGVKDAAARRGVRLLFLPPYTPQWQPVEMFFSALKRAYRRVDRSCGSIDDRVSRCIAEVGSAIDPRNMFARCRRLAGANTLS